MSQKRSHGSMLSVITKLPESDLIIPVYNDDKGHKLIFNQAVNSIFSDELKEKITSIFYICCNNTETNLLLPICDYYFGIFTPYITEENKMYITYINICKSVIYLYYEKVLKSLNNDNPIVPDSYMQVIIENINNYDKMTGIDKILDAIKLIDYAKIKSEHDASAAARKTIFDSGRRSKKGGRRRTKKIKNKKKTRERNERIKIK